MADEDPDDPQLKALRAVWLSMRDSDEDPPDSGVSALMAAARSQASMMAAAQAPWWKRLFDQLRRPPVLALASLLVVIGGAVLLTNHHDALEKAPTSAPAPQKELPHSNLDIGGTPAATATPDQKIDLEVDQKVEQKDAEKADDRKKVEIAPPRPGPVHHRPPAHTTSGDGMTSPPTTAPAFEAGEAKAKADAAPPPSQILVDQLAAQARKAAQRGDCENARAIATRIAGQDAAYYRDHVAGDLASCVSVPAAADTAAH